MIILLYADTQKTGDIHSGSGPEVKSIYPKGYIIQF